MYSTVYNDWLIGRPKLNTLLHHLFYTKYGNILTSSQVHFTIALYIEKQFSQLAAVLILPLVAKLGLLNK
jgi:hypothetical protein